MTDSAIFALVQPGLDNVEKFPNLFRAWLALSALTTGLTALYPNRVTRPAFARFIVGAFDPIAFNPARWLRPFRSKR